MQQARAGHPALQNGLLFGVILGILEIILPFILNGLGFIINVLLYLFLVGYAGYRAAARTGKVSTGLVAGLLVGLLSSVIACVPLLVYYLSNIDAFRAQLQQQIVTNSVYRGMTLTNNLVIVSVILFLVLLVAGATLLGLGIGSIGGAIGKGQAPRPQMPQYPPYMPQYPPQEYVPPAPQPRQPFYPEGDYTSPDAYRLPQENPPAPPPKESGPFISQE